MLFGVPPDPAYILFRDGLLIANNDVTDESRWRWSPGKKTWNDYRLVWWSLEDVGIPDTSPGTTFHLIRDDDPAVERSRADLFLPDLFSRLSQHYARYGTSRPNIVWSWHDGGDWMDAKAIAPEKTGSGGLTVECIQRVDNVRAWVRRGDMTAADGQRRIREIITECT